MGRAALVGSLLGSSLVVYACVGDEPERVVPSVDGGTDTGPSSSEDDAGEKVDGGNGNGDACDGGSTCEGVCVDTSSDPENCGRCAHDCGKGTCESGVCKPALIADVGDGGAAITSLTTDQTDDNPQGLAQRVFWSATGTGGGVFQDNVVGGDKVTLSTAPPTSRSNVVVSQSNVFWFSQNFGGAPQPVLKGQVNIAASQASVGTMNASFIQSILYDATTKNVVGSYAVNATQHGIFKCGPGGGVTCTSAITYSGQPGGNVATDGTGVYFCDPDNGLILRTALTGGSSSSYVTNQATPNLLRVDGTNLYWSNSGTKTIQRGGLGGGTPKQLASAASAADGLAADAVNVYWTETATGKLSYAPITGAGPTTAYVTLGASTVPMRLVRDTGFLYFSHGTAIYRVALP